MSKMTSFFLITYYSFFRLHNYRNIMYTFFRVERMIVTWKRKCACVCVLSKENTPGIDFRDFDRSRAYRCSFQDFMSWFLFFQ